jgi:hypothetical protein
MGLLGGLVLYARGAWLGLPFSSMPDRGSGSHCSSIRHKATNYLTFGQSAVGSRRQFAIDVSGAD